MLVLLIILRVIVRMKNYMWMIKIATIVNTITVIVARCTLMDVGHRRRLTGGLKNVRKMRCSEMVSRPGAFTGKVDAGGGDADERIRY